MKAGLKRKGVNSYKVVVLVVLWSGVVGCFPCEFNTMCTCKSPPDHHSNNSRDITCLGVPLSRLPELSGSWIEHIDVIEGGLEIVEGDSLALPHLGSLRLISNQILLLAPKSLASSSKALRSLDLSYNQLEAVPLDSLRHLRALEWLNLHGNSISSLGEETDWGTLRHSLTNVFLGENDLRDLGQEYPLSHFRKLVSVSLERNNIMHLDSGSLPPTVQTLSASHNMIRKFPVELVDNLRAIAWLYLRDNYIESIPPYSFKTQKNFDKLDLGDNFLTAVPIDAFNSTVTIRDLNLDCNYFKTLPALAFKGLTIGRISISMNKLETVNERAFEGLGNSLEYLELGGNRLQKVPRAISTLTKLKYLYIPSNNLTVIQPDAFSSFSESLNALSLSRNKLEEIPKHALKKCNQLAHLNLGYNYIRDVAEADFLGWGHRLDTLLLMNNRIVQIHEHTFHHTPHLRELSLSFNKITELHEKAFTDVSNSLESLEISFSLYQEDFPEDSLRPMSSIVWMALDNNNFRTIKDTALSSFKHLRYLNLDGNRLCKLPFGLFNSEIHRQLRDVRISYNHLQIIESNVFDGLEELQYIVLAGNQISNIESYAFTNLPNKVSIFLSENRIANIGLKAFSSIHDFLKLDLHCNELHEFSLASFFNVTNADHPLSLNLSRNALMNLQTGDFVGGLFVSSVDLSYNVLSEVPKLFFETIGDVLRRIYLGYNHIWKLDESAFSSLQNLEALALEHNKIEKLRKRAFAGLPRLQILDLSHNHIEQLHMEQFKHLVNLRVMDLSYNHLRSIPRDAFQNTKLERIDLSNNQLVSVPSASLGEVGFTLRLLDVSHNQIEHLDSTVFPETPHLTTLNLCHNRITLVPDNVFTSVGGLLRLDICGNRVRANFKELFHYLQGLRSLNLASTGLKSAPVLPLPNLISLNLSDNAITDLPRPIVEYLPNLRTLIISHCRFTTLPSNAWIKLPLLKNLDISFNPIKALTKESLTGLSRLEYLEMDGLDSLERVENEAFWGCRWLRRLGMQSGHRLGVLLSSLPYLTRLTVRVLEKRLSSQLTQLSSKLAYLEIKGEALKEIEPTGLIGLAREAVLAIRSTSIEELPLGLLSGLGHVTHLTLDIRDNKITSLSPDTFYFNLTGWENIGTKLISGGLLLKGNPLSCDCSLVWVGHWLRRWVRESLVIHTTDPETGQKLVRAVREATCKDRSGRALPLLELHPEQLSCHASALSAAAQPFSSFPFCLPLFLLLFR
ncbi:chaoptin [Cimex lectularius]|uniref:LRRCT domain-containing protein n=1 Tax=Cimex lectularius TaxID=79782 RepID=A0A8I6RH40_CIMLE|nr:chaoptin [Cimex lectularius]